VKRILILGAVVTLASGCGLSREKAPTAPGSGTAQIQGTVARAGSALAGFKVKLYNDDTGAQVDSTFTDGQGRYGFNGVGAGNWMVKVSPVDPGDLGYVRYFFNFTSGGQTAVVPPFDVSAHGFDLVAPAADAHVSPPTFSSPIHFQWTLYQGTYNWTSARLDDASGTLAWASAQGQDASADWNGIGNSGSYAGQTVPLGTYTWRVKIHLPNAVQGATRVRTLVLQ